MPLTASHDFLHDLHRFHIGNLDFQLCKGSWRRWHLYPDVELSYFTMAVLGVDRLLPTSFLGWPPLWSSWVCPRCAGWLSFPTAPIQSSFQPMIFKPEHWLADITGEQARRQE